MTDYSTLSDYALQSEIHAAREAVSASLRLKQLEQEQARRQRDATARATERDTLFVQLMKRANEYRARFVKLLDGLDVAPPSDDDAITEEAYVCGRQAYALFHDLAVVIGDKRLEIRWDVPDQIILHGGRKAEAFLLSYRKVTVPMPWADDLKRLRQLTPRVEQIGNGG